MPPKSSRAQPGQLVTAVLVSHDGGEWLGDCLAGLTGQTRPPARVVAVDTGSTDGSDRVLADVLGDTVVRLPRTTAFATAVQAGLDAFDGAPEPPGTRGTAVTHWVWILHDDCAPEPTALAELLAVAADSPSVAAVGPKVISWDGRRLLEVGLTIDSSGRTQTGLERREVDQGQHDDVGDVLAVGTAGLLVRREVWDRLGGLDATWPLFGEDVDFGWRVNAAGERVHVAPRAVVRHAAAMRFGRRNADAVHGPALAARRRHGMQVVLANTSTVLVPLLVIRYVIECLARALALLLLGRQPGAAAAEVAGLGGVFAGLGVIRRARRKRHERTVPHRDLRSLLAPSAWRWRSFGDRLAEVFGGRAAADQRQRRRAPVETGPVAEEAESIQIDDTGMLTRALRRPGVIVALGLTVLGLIAARRVLGGDLHGGRLLPAPAGASDLWHIYFSGWHDEGLGSTTEAPPSLALLALMSTLLLGKAWLAVSVLVLGAVPLAGLSAYVALRPVTASAWLRASAALVWAATPVLTGAVAGGRLDVVVLVILLPVVARRIGTALGRGAAEWPGCVSAGLLLAVVVAFAPLTWVLAAVALVLAVALNDQRRDRALGAVAILAVPVAVLLPWSYTLFAHPSRIPAGMGLAETLRSVRPLGGDDVALMHPGGPAQAPVWVLAPLLLAAVVGLARRSGVLARAGWFVYVTGAVGALVVTHLSGAVDGDPTVRYWAGVPIAVATAGALLAAVVAGDGARDALRRYPFGWRQPAAAILVGGLVAGIGTAVVFELSRGTDRPLSDSTRQLLPVFAAAEVARATAPRLVALRPTTGAMQYAVVRDADGLRLGDADVLPTSTGSRAAARLDKTLREAVAGQGDAVPRLAEFGVSMLVVPRGTAGVARLADVDGLDRVPTTDALVWRSSIPTGELVVLSPSAARPVARGSGLPAGSTPHPLPAQPGHSRAAVPDGPSDRLLVLAEPASGHWRANLDGRELPRTTAYGWAQAWRLPSAGGRLDLRRTGDHRTAWLALQIVAVVGAVVLANPVRRRSDDDGGRGGTS